VITGVTVTNPGIATVIPQSTCTFTQSATSGSGSTATFTGTFSPIASNINFASLATGGGLTNGNLFLGAETPAATMGGGESTFVGTRAGGAFTGAATANTAIGHDACGKYGSIAPAGNYNTCLGNDAGRNISGTATASNTLLGQGAGENVSANGNTAVGQAALVGSSTFSGTNNTVVGNLAMQGSSMTTAQGNVAVGQSSLQAITTATYNVMLGLNAGGKVTTGGSNVCIGPGACNLNLTTGARNIVIGTGTCDVATSGTNDSFVVCASGGATQIFGSSNINTTTPAWLMAGTFTISGLASAGTQCVQASSTGALSGTGAACGGSGSTGANPTATASDTAVTGVATTFMRSDAAPAVQKTSSSVFGLAKVDGTSITAAAGVITSVPGVASRTVTGATDTILSTDRGNIVFYNSASAIAVSQPAPSGSFAAGFFTTLCNINAGTPTVTPGSGTVGGGATYPIPAGTAASPSCITYQSDGTNFNAGDVQASYGTGVQAALGKALSAAGGLTSTIASGTAALGTSAIASAACATVVTATAINTATTDVLTASFNGDPTAVTGYIPATAGMLTIISYPTANTANFKVCNNSNASITPGAITLNWRVVR
jgi:hypothetical protein